MQPGIYNLALYKGDTKRLTVTLKSGPDLDNLTPINLTGATAAAQIRATVAGGSIMAEFDCTLSGTPTDGVVNLHLPPVDAEALIPGSAVWDLEVTRAGGDVETYLKGTVTITDDVTETP
jgi:hypothetical protein